MKVLYASLLSFVALAQDGQWVGVSRGGGVNWWGGQFSEENNGFSEDAPEQGFIGWQCYGDHCDNKRLRIPPNSPKVLGPRGNTNILTVENISEEENRSNMNCGGRLLSQMQCHGSYCDNTNVYCRNLASGFRITPGQGEGHYTGWFNQNNPAMDCPDDMWLWGFQCRDGYCGAQRLRCVRLQQFMPAENCEVSAWGEPGECSKTCGGGEQTLKRTVQKQAKYGGAECPDLEMTQACNEQDCKCQGQKNSDAYPNTFTKLKGGTNEYQSLVNENEDPVCECYDKCKGSDLGADVFLYYVKSGGAKCKCMKANPDRSKVKMKEKTGYTSGFITDAGKNKMDAKKAKKANKKRRRRRRNN